ncbi:MAG: hypothetical protein JWQ40_3320 [Segetibacter sp.]|nr:hypothetical protein [Segetibacter sp.]
MEKLSRFQNALFGNALKSFFLAIALLLLQPSVKSQVLDSLMTGNWFEIYKKKKTYYLPLQIQLKDDKTAKYINRYPEQSHNLTFELGSDSSLTLSNGEKYKVLFLNGRVLRLRKTGVKTFKEITLRKAYQARK